jgi:hypothetical protein
VEEYLAERSKNVFNHDFDRGFVRPARTIFAPLVLKTVFVLESYLNGRRSSFAILNFLFSPAFCRDKLPHLIFVSFLAGIKISRFGFGDSMQKLQAYIRAGSFSS